MTCSCNKTDAYYQEIGRAGRDGEPSDIKLFYHPDDLKLQRFLGSSGTIAREELLQLTQQIQSQTDPIAKAAIQADSSLSAAKLGAAFTYLEAAELIEQLDTDRIVSQPINDLEQQLDQAETVQQRQHTAEQSQLQMIQDYAETNTCRRESLLSYFGEPFEGPCNRCDNCRQQAAPTDQYLQPFPLGSTIIHTSFGRGQVLRYEADKVVILFETVGYKTFVTELIADAVRCMDSP